MTLNCIYSLSDNGYAKEKFSFATKRYCLDNFLKHFSRFSTSVHILIDETNLKDETRQYINSLPLFSFNEGCVSNIVYYTGGSSAASWRKSVEYVLSTLKDDDYFYRCEDDYLHRSGAHKVMIEGLSVSDYVSLYDHNDKYINANDGGNPFIVDGGELTRVIRTQTAHWKLTNSTTMTLATSVKVLKEDMHIWEPFTLGTHPHDFQSFLELGKKGRSLITPIPGYSTHCEPRWASPGIDWESNDV